MGHECSVGVLLAAGAVKAILLQMTMAQRDCDGCNGPAAPGDELPIDTECMNENERDAFFMTQCHFY